MYVIGYDAQNNYQRVNLRLGELWLSDLRALQSGTATIGGVTATITATHSATLDSILITLNEGATDSDFFLRILHALGLTSNNLFDYATTPQSLWPDSSGLMQLSTYNAGLSPYYYTLQSIVSGNRRDYNLGIGSIDVNSFVINGTYFSYCAPLGVHTANGDLAFGAMSVYSNDSSSQIRIVSDLNVTNHSYLQPQAAPGEKGFRPIGLPADEPATGGGDTNNVYPVYNTDILAQPGAPDESVASVVGSGFLTVYDVTSANLANLGKCLFSSNIISAVANMIINPIDFIVSLNIFPYTPHIGSSVPIKLGWFNCTEASAGFNANGAPLTSQFRVVDFGTLSVAEMWQSFLDYDATSFELFLPFIGFVSLSINEIMGGSINVQYTIDFYTGMCVANVLCIRNVKTGTQGVSEPQYSQHAYQGNCAIQVPISQIGYSNMIGSIINAGVQGIRSGTGAGALTTLANDMLSGGMQPDVTSKGSIVANAGYCSILYPYITITRPLTAEPESFQAVMGYPSYNANKLGVCEGLCICDNIDLSGLSGATDNEIRRIKQMCLEGVYV